jgi:flagellar biosynthesis GTPase FlhF
MSRTFQHVRLIHERARERRRSAPTCAAARACAPPWRLDRAEERRLLAEAARQLRARRPGRAPVRAAGSLPLGSSASWRSRAPCAADPAACCCSTSRRPACATWRSRRWPSCCAKLRGEGMAILLVEHDMDFVMGLADRVVVMEFGEQMAEGLPKEIQTRIRKCSKPISEGSTMKPCCSKSTTCASTTARRSLHKVNLRSGGEIVTVIGPNGAGKTTCSRPDGPAAGARRGQVPGPSPRWEPPRWSSAGGHGHGAGAGEARAVRHHERWRTTCCSAPSQR